MGMSISEVARRSGCSAPTIRYYEGIGLIGVVARTPAGRRTYGWPEVTRLKFIRRTRELGLSIDEVRGLLGASGKGGNQCAPAAEIIGRQLAAVQAKLDELQELRASLKGMLAQCRSTCAGQPGADCTIFEALGSAGA